MESEKKLNRLDWIWCDRSATTAVASGVFFAPHLEFLFMVFSVGITILTVALKWKFWLAEKCCHCLCIHVFRLNAFSPNGFMAEQMHTHARTLTFARPPCTHSADMYVWCLSARKSSQPKFYVRIYFCPSKFMAKQNRFLWFAINFRHDIIKCKVCPMNTRFCCYFCWTVHEFSKALSGGCIKMNGNKMNGKNALKIYAHQISHIAIFEKRNKR